MRPQYEYGDAVRVVRTVRNDGTFPGERTGTILIRCGSIGYVRDVGTFLQDQLIYSVHFIENGRVIGCREEELQSASAPWIPNQFEFRDRVVARVPLGIQGRVLVQIGEIGEVLRVIRDADQGVTYHVHFADRNTLIVPETALAAMTEYTNFETVQVENQHVK